jgi:glutamate 5-kinase
VIADGGAPEVLLRIAAGENVGTRFIAGTATSSTRRWLASAKHYTTASVHVNEGAAAALSAHNRLASLLPVGIDRIEGEFKRGDVVQVLGPDGQVIACGKAQYDADDARAAIGLQGQKPLVHYDYLYLVARMEGRPND